MSFQVPLPKAITDELANAVEDQGPYASPQVLKVRVSPERSHVIVELKPGADEAAIRPVVEQYISDFVKRFRSVAGQIFRKVERKVDKEAHATGIFHELVKRGWAFQLGDGQVGLAGTAMRLVTALDERFGEMAMRLYGAAPHRYPSFIPTDVLRRCGYFNSFPHLVTMISHFTEDYEKLKQIRDANVEGSEVVVPDLSALVNLAACITPATCYHCYQALQGQTVKSTGQTFTATGRCARYESTNMIGLDRLWEFTMRELILVGSEAWVAETRNKALESYLELVTEWDLECTVETANDPFFAPAYATKSFWQSQSNLKYELRFTVEPKPDGTARTISCGSANLHEGSFGKTFDIKLEDGTGAFTGCVALGVERLALAVFTQHGFNPNRWPPALRKACWD